VYAREVDSGGERDGGSTIGLQLLGSRGAWIRRGQLYDMIVVTRMRMSRGRVVVVSMLRARLMLEHDRQPTCRGVKRNMMLAVGQDLNSQAPRDAAAHQRHQERHCEQGLQPTHHGGTTVQTRFGQLMMPMMEIGDVRMLMLEPRVPVLMRVRLAGRIAGSMGVPVMLVVHMAMVVLHRLMGVDVAVPFAK
jgi:hypothetical protein